MRLVKLFRRHLIHCLLRCLPSQVCAHISGQRADALATRKLSRVETLLHLWRS